MSTLTFEADRDTVTTNGIRAIKVDVDSYDSGVLQSYTVYPKTLRDIYLMGIGDKIRDKKEWWIKFENEEIWNKWMKELRDAAGQPDDWEDEESQSAEDEVVEEDKKDPVSEVKKVIGVSEDTGEIMTTEVEPKDTGDDGEGAGDEAAEHEEADDEAADDEEAEDEEASDGEGRTWPENKFITRRMEAYLKEELRHCAKYRKAELGIDDALDRIYKSDILIPAELKSELITNVAPLSNIPDSQKDWHPGSNQRVHDLVHPSLYPLIYGKSRLCATRPLGSPCLPHSRSGKIIDFDAKASRVYGFNRHVTSDFVSTQFQWLPSEFTIDPSTKEAKITSYINNLHPVHHKKLYYTIEKVLTKCIPMFDMVLLGLRYEHGGVTRVIDSPYDHWPEQPSYEGELTDEEEEALWDDWQNTRQVIIPDAEDFEAHHPQRVIPPWVPKELHPVAPPKPIKPPSPEVESPPKLDPAEDVEMSGTQVDESEEKADGDSFTVEEEGNDDADEGEGSDDDPDEEEENDDDAGEEGDNDDDGGQGQKPVVLSSKNTLSDFGKGQIIVKLANIELTPEKPTYEGGVWHLEGTVVSSAPRSYSCLLDNFSLKSIF